MISNLSKKLTNFLIKKEQIDKSESELYNYGLFMLLSHLFFFLVTLISGIIFSTVIESIIFFVAFQSIRRYAGGYHASKEIICDITTSITLIGSVGIIKLSLLYNFDFALIISSLVMAALILLFCPLDTDEKPLEKAEYKHFRIISLIILFVLVLLLMVFFKLGFRKIYLPISLSLILEGLLITAGKISKKFKAHKK